MAATALEAAFLFDNLDRCCLHAVPSFGDIGPGEASTTVSRFYLAQGTLDGFLQRLEADRPALAARQQWARPAEAAVTTKPHGRMEEMSPDELERVLAESPIAFVPLGTYEHHGFHLPVCSTASRPMPCANASPSAPAGRCCRHSSTGPGADMSATSGRSCCRKHKSHR